MSAHLHSHVRTNPPALSEAEQAIARWEDDGGPIHQPTGPDSGVDHWLRIAAALGERLPELAEREDVIVTCGHGTRSGAPAAFYPDLASLEIDAALFAPCNPATIDPSRPGDENKYPVAWGAFTHEAAHAAHSRWTFPPALRGTAADSAAQVLEESRAERAHLDRRPADRPFLRAAVRTLVLEDFTSSTSNDPWQAAVAAGLLLARRDAGILDPDETEPLEQAVTAILGKDTLDTLAEIWSAAHTTGDQDSRTMLRHAQAWCKALGADPTESEPTPDRTATTSDLAKAVGSVIGRVQAHETAHAAAEARAEATRTARRQAKAAQVAQARRAAATAEKVFTSGQRPFNPRAGMISQRPSPVVGTRQPRTAERSAAGHLAKALRAAAYRERTTTEVPSAAPPGRLNMRGALARDAQRAVGATPTAMPWTRAVHRPNPTPPLRVAIAVDVSGSMDAATAPMASAAWIVAQATALTDPDSRSATVTYDQSITAITTPGRAPRQVTEFNATGLGHSLAEAVDALTAGVDLLDPGAGRLLVIASDGYYNPDEADHAAERITALRAAGCAVLWLAFAPDPRPLPGVTVLELTDPAQAAAAIGKAAAKALASTNP
ncbi:VWA domain-containing protein [Actinacidiphila yeochonensis]|uniref:VWA domain-containing protein n=1 Tax=Actinacidiphila yeochonensis TaxID=89050 RepID=UPI000562F3E2|nr:VWA domain-containing protein [Actinacidiphila yeochonensis]